MKLKIKSFECPKSVRNYEKNTWNVRRLVDELFVPLAQQTSVLYCRLSNFKSLLPNLYTVATRNIGYLSTSSMKNEKWNFGAHSTHKCPIIMRDQSATLNCRNRVLGGAKINWLIIVNFQYI